MQDDPCSGTGNKARVAARIADRTAVSVRVPFGHEALSGVERGSPIWLSFEADAAHVFSI